MRITPDKRRNIFIAASVVMSSVPEPRNVAEPVENNVPTWSRDGTWIYFSSNRTGSRFGESHPRIPQGVRVFAWWRAVPGGIYFVDGSTTLALVKFFDMATERVKTITTLDRWS